MNLTIIEAITLPGGPSWNFVFCGSFLVLLSLWPYMRKSFLKVIGAGGAYPHY